MREHGLSQAEIESRSENALHERILTLISKQTSAEVESGLKAYFPLNVLDQYCVRARLPAKAEAIEDVALIANHSAVTFAARSIEKLGFAVACCKREDSTVSKVSFYPKGRCLKAAAELWFNKATVSLAAVERINLACERLTMACLDYCAKSVVVCVSELCSCEATMSECNPPLVSGAVVDRLSRVALTLRVAGLERFVAAVADVLKGSIDHTTWCTEPERKLQRDALSSWFEAAASLDRMEQMRTFCNEAFDSLAVLAKAKDILDLLTQLPEKVNKDRLQAQEAVELQRMLASSFRLSAAESSMFGESFALALNHFQDTCPLLKDGSALKKLKDAVAPRIEKLFGKLLELVASPLLSKTFVGEGAMGNQSTARRTILGNRTQRVSCSFRQVPKRGRI